VQSLHALVSRRRDEEQGFTLIELMVVVLIIAILIAIAIPTFLGARQRAQDRAAQSDLRNGLTAEKVTYTDTQTYSSDTAANGVMRGIEPSLKWGAGLSVVVGDAVAANDAGTVCLSEASKSGKVFEIADIATGANAGTYFGKDAAGCPAAALGGANLVALGTAW
jgi:type IV pilus assembly protein PilA